MTNTSIPFDTRLTDEQSALVASCERMAVRVALKVKGEGDNLDDLISAGYDGLVRAAQTYDPSLSKFSTHAYRWAFAKAMRCRRNTQIRYAKTTHEIPYSFIPTYEEPFIDESRKVDPAEVKKAVKALPPKLRDVVKNYVMNAGHLRETAKKLKCSPQTVLTRKAKAFDMLRLSLWKYGLEEAS